MSDRDDLYLFFERPTEPIFMQKGAEKAYFDLPDNYLPKEYDSVKTELSTRFGDDSGRTIPIRNIALPDLSVPLQLDYNERFSLFILAHRQWAGRLIDILMNMYDIEDLKSLCSYCQLRINPYMFNYCLSVAMLHRPDTRGMTIPSLATVFPGKFMDPRVLRRAREQANVVPLNSRLPITIPVNFTASDLEPEQRIAYFREDIGINLHHWHWHLVYPMDATDTTIVAKDRRGELFYYMHSQIIARYNAERLCNNLGKVVPFDDFKAPIAEGYFPKLDSAVASRTLPPRLAGTKISNIRRPEEQIQLDVEKLFTWRDRFIEAIEDGTVKLPNGNHIPLEEKTAVDILGNMLESSIISVNRDYYGDFHNSGHIFTAYAHDPDKRHLERAGVMGDVATAMRDPVFYRWHACVDNLMEIYKQKLPPYSRSVLDFSGISVSSISVEGPGGSNTFSTFWEQNTLELSRGLDFAETGPVLTNFTHLQHEECNYVIQVNNMSGKSKTGTFRVFMAPVNDEYGRAFSFEDQRRLMIELDKFTQPLSVGTNTIRQNSLNSSVTIPFETTFRNQSDRPGQPKSPEAAQFDFCGCGWPQHMLFPKGTTTGYPVVLFVMVSNWDDDKINQDLVGTCNNAASYCGLKDRKYPDRRAMGYPFDRPAPANSLSSFLTPNMAIRNCVIRFTDVTRQRGKN